MLDFDGSRFVYASFKLFPHLFGDLQEKSCEELFLCSPLIWKNEGSSIRKSLLIITVMAVLLFGENGLSCGQAGDILYVRSLQRALYPSGW